MIKQLTFSNSNIDLVCEEVDAFLRSVGVEKREALRSKLTLEEVLLEYQDRLGEDASFTIKCVKRFFSIKVELIVEGSVFNPLEKGDEENAVNSILAGIGLAPAYAYKNGKNYVVFSPKRKPLSGTLKMGVAILLGTIIGIILNLFPEDITEGVNEYLLDPLTDAFVGLISAISIPLIFLSVLNSICSMGNMETLGKIGRKTIRTILVSMVVISILMTAFACLFYTIEWEGGDASSLTQVLTLIYDIVPSNVFEPFVTGNTLQVIFIATMVGLAMLILSTRVNGVFTLVGQFTSIAQTIMSGLSSLLPILIFVLFAGTISGGDFEVLFDSWKVVAVFLLLIAIYYVATLFYISAKQQVPLGLLLRKTWKTLVIALVTASSAAALPTNVKDSRKRLGIDKKLVDFGVPFGQVLFDPAGIALIIAIELTMAEIYGIPITPSFIVIAIITNLFVSIATPPVPGGGIMIYAIAFSQLGIPMEAMGVVLVIDMLTDFPITACNVTGWQLTLIDVADSLNMLDKETLRREK